MEGLRLVLTRRPAHVKHTSLSGLGTGLRLNAEALAVRRMASAPVVSCEWVGGRRRRSKGEAGCTGTSSCFPQSLSLGQDAHSLWSLSRPLFSTSHLIPSFLCLLPSPLVLPSVDVFISHQPQSPMFHTRWPREGPCWHSSCRERGHVVSVEA